MSCFRLFLAPVVLSAGFLQYQGQLISLFISLIRNQPVSVTSTLSIFLRTIPVLSWPLPMPLPASPLGAPGRSQTKKEAREKKNLVWCLFFTQSRPLQFKKGRYNNWSLVAALRYIRPARTPRAAVESTNRHRRRPTRFFFYPASQRLPPRHCDIHFFLFIFFSLRNPASYLHTASFHTTPVNCFHFLPSFASPLPLFSYPSIPSLFRRLPPFLSFTPF